MSWCDYHDCLDDLCDGFRHPDQELISCQQCGQLIMLLTDMQRRLGEAEAAHRDMAAKLAEAKAALHDIGLHTLVLSDSTARLVNKMCSDALERL